MEEREKIRVLLVEDNYETSKLYHSMLTKHGFLVDLAYDGQEAFDKIMVGGFDLILLDVKLPKMTGIEVLSELKESKPKLKNGPIVMLTNIGDETVVRKTVELGAASYMDKSNLDPSELVEKVEGMLGVASKKGL